MSLERTLRRSVGPRLWIAIVATTVVVGLLTYPEMPEQMTVHWRVGVDGTVTERTTSRRVGGFAIATVSVALLAVALAVSRVVRDRAPEIETFYDIVVTLVFLAFGTTQVLLLTLNLL